VGELIRLVEYGRDIDPAAYAAGGRDFQRLVLSGITVASVPEPSSRMLLAGGACVLPLILLSAARAGARPAAQTPVAPVA
jgi:hypothetical protein